MGWMEFFDVGRLIFLIPIVAILGWMLSSVLKHRERMAMIERGMHPGPDEDEREERTESAPRR